MHRESLYTLIWDHLLKSTLYQLYLTINNSDIPWPALHKLEYDWNTKPLNLPAFHSLEYRLRVRLDLEYGTPGERERIRHGGRGA